METDPTMPVDNPAGNKIGKPSEIDVEFLLRDIEEKNLDRTLFNAKKQIWDRNESFYGPPGSEKRATLGRFISNNIKKLSWARYVALLERKGIDMSETTETKLEEELKNGPGPKDVPMEKHDPVVTFDKPAQNATLIPSVSSDPVAMLTDQLGSATISTKSPASTRASPFGSPAQGLFSTQAFASPAIQQRLSFDEPKFSMSNEYPLCPYIMDGTPMKPIPIYFNDKHPHHHGPLFIHNCTVEVNGQDYQATVVQKSGPIAEVNNVHLAIATHLPQGYEKFLGYALEYKELVANCFSQRWDNFAAGPSEEILKKAPTVKALKIAEVACQTNEMLKWNHYIILFPLNGEPFDNRVFSTSDTRVQRDTKPNPAKDNMSGKVMYGFTSTWRIAHAGRSSVVEMRGDDKIDTKDFFGAFEED